MQLKYIDKRGGGWGKGATSGKIRKRKVKFRKERDRGGVQWKLQRGTVQVKQGCSFR